MAWAQEKTIFLESGLPGNTIAESEFPALAISRFGVPFTIRTNIAPSKLITFKVRVRDEGPTDFVSTFQERERSINIVSGTTFATIYIKPKVDPFTDVDGKISIEIVEAPAGYKITGGKLTYTVTNDPSISHPELRITGGGEIKETGRALFTLTLEETINETLDVQVRIKDDPDANLLLPSEEGIQSIEIPKGFNRWQFWVPTIADTIVNTKGTISATIISTDPKKFRFSSTNTAQVKVTNDDSLDGQNLQVSNFKVKEGEEASLVLKLPNQPIFGRGFSTTSVKVELLTDNLGLRGAVAADPSELDIAGTAKLVSFKRDQVATLKIQTKNDDIYEYDEVFGVRLYDPVRLGLGPTNELVVYGTIIDSEDRPVLSAVGFNTTEKNDGQTSNMKFRLTTSKESVRTISVKKGDARTGTADSNDYQKITSERVTFSPGQKQKDVTVAIKGDTIREPKETVVLRLSQPRNVKFESGGRYLDVEGNIFDNDEPFFFVKFEDAGLVKEGSLAVFRANLHELNQTERLYKAPQDFSIRWSTVDGTATAGEDYDAVTQQELEIPKGSTGVNFFVKTLADQTNEGKETFTVGINGALEPPLNFNILASAKASSKATITDAPTLVVSDASKATEGQKAVFTVDIGFPTTNDVTVHWKTVDGTAKAGKDYTGQARKTLVIPAGETSGTITVPILQDSLDESEEQFFLEVEKVDVTDPDSVELQRQRGTATIRDDDSRPAISINDIRITEGQKGQFRVSLSAVSGKPVEVSWITRDGTAKENADYRKDEGSVTIPIGQKHVDIEVQTIDDSTKEEEETFKVLLFNTPEGKRQIGEADATIVDNDNTVTLSVSDATVTEAAGNPTANFTVKLSSALKTAASVEWKTRDGTGLYPAKSGGIPAGTNDYQSVSPTTLNFSPGETKKTISVTILDDNVAEDDETFLVELQNASGATVADGVGTGRIIDDDSVRYTIEGTETEIREGNRHVFTVRRNKSGSKIRIRVCLDPGTAIISDRTGILDDVRITTRFNEANGCGRVATDAAIATNLVFGTGDLKKSIVIHTIQDSRVEGDEKFTIKSASAANDGVRFLPPSQRGSNSKPLFSREFTILDDDSHRIQIEKRHEVLWEGEIAQYDIYLDPPLAAGTTGTVTYSTVDGTAKSQDKDYVAVTSQSLALGPPPSSGSPAGTISITTTEDTKGENDETFSLVLSNPSNSITLPSGGGHIVEDIILDDDALRVFVDNTVVDEGDEAGVRVWIPETRGQDVVLTWMTETVTGGAESPEDFTAVAGEEATISAGEKSIVLPVETKQDSKVEQDEKLIIKITKTNPGGFLINDTGTVTIRDDDQNNPMFEGYENASVEENKIWTSPIPTIKGNPYGDLTWTAEGDDAADFQINADNGQLTLSARNFENPEDANKDNVYHVTVRATDEDGNTETESIALTVTNVNTLEVKAVPQPEAGHSEGEKITFGLTRVLGTQTTATFNWKTVPDSTGTNPASATDDYTTVEVQENVQLLSDTTNLFVQTSDDLIDEENETFKIRFSNLKDGVTDDAVFVDGDGNVIAGGEMDIITTITDNDTRGVEVSPGSLTIAAEVDDGGTDDTKENEQTYTIKLLSQPTDDVVIDVGVPNGAPFTVDKTRLTFTPSGAGIWSTAQTVKVTAINDEIDNTGNKRSATLTHTLTAGDSDYGGVSVGNVAVVVTDDDDTPGGITLSVDADKDTGGVQTSLAENAGTKTVVVTATVDGGTTYPDATTVAVVVGAADDGATEGTDYAAVADKSIVIPVGRSSATVEFALAITDDALDEDAEKISIAGSSGSLTITDTAATITITDNDTRGVEVSPGSLTIAAEVDDGGTDDTKENEQTYTIKLLSQPTDDVVIDVGVPNGAPFTVDKTRLTFTPSGAGIWSTAQTVKVTAINDEIDNTGNKRSATLTHTLTAGDSDYGGVSVGNVAVVVTDDDDTPGGITLSVDADKDTGGVQTSLAENAGTKTVVVTATVDGGTTYPDATTVAVVVGAADDGATEGTDYDTVAHQSITIPADTASADVTFTLTPTNDTLVEDDETISIEGSLTGVTITGTTITLTSEDVAPAIEFSIADASATEGSDITFTVTRSGASGDAVSVKWNTTADTTADADVASTSDYTTTTTAQTLSFGAGVTTQTITVATTNDVYDEPNETFQVVLSDPSTGTSIDDGIAIGTITDNDDAPAITLSVDADTGTNGIQTSIAEDGGTKTVEVTATLTGTTRLPTSQDVTIEVGKAGDSASEGTDYTTVANQTITIPADGSSATVEFDLVVTNDTIDESNEAISLAGTSGSLTITNPPAITITDDDTKGVVVSASSLTIAAEEDDTSTDAIKENEQIYTIKLLSQPTDDVVITVAVPDGAPFTVDQTSLTFTPSGAGIWSTAQTVTVTAVNDDIDNTDNKRKATLTHTLTVGDSDYGGVSVGNVDVIVKDDDEGTSTFAIENAVAIEGNAITFTVTRTGATGSTASVSWNTADDTNGDHPASISDYTPQTTAQILNFAAGVTSKTFTVQTIQDTMHEEDETFLVKLTTPSTGTSITDDTAIGTITNDDVAPVTMMLTVDTNLAMNGEQNDLEEDDGEITVMITATLGGTTTFDVDKTITCKVGNTTDSAIKGTDYVAVQDQTITIPAGMTSGSVTFLLVPMDDNIDEDPELITLEASFETLDVPEAEIIINEEDNRGVMLSPTSLTISAEEDDGETAEIKENEKTYTIKLLSQPTDDVVINVEVPDEAPFTVAPTSLTFTPSGAKIWSTAQTVTVTATNDDIDNTDGKREATITHSITAGDSDYEGATVGNVDVVVTDDDEAATFAIEDVSATEGDALTFTVTRAGATGSAASVSWNTAEDTNGDHPASTSDYTPQTEVQILEFVAGDTSKTFTVETTQDTMDEADETFLVQLSSPSTGTSITDDVAIGTITDDDLPMPVVAFAASTSSVMEDVGTHNVMLSIDPSPAEDITLIIVQEGGTATSGEDHMPMSGSVMVPAGGDSAVIPVVIMDDNVPEKQETVMFNLMASPEYAMGEKDEHELMINDNDEESKNWPSEPLGKWQIRFGRAVAEQALEAVADRIDTPLWSQTERTFAGYPIDLNSNCSEFASEQTELSTEILVTDECFNSFNESQSDDLQQPTSMTLKEALLQSSFTIVGKTDIPHESYALWGRAAQSNFEGREGSLSLEGKTTTAMFGADQTKGKWQVGVAVMQSKGKGSYTGTENKKGDIEASLTSIIPYTSLATSDRFKIWGALGYGNGWITLKPDPDRIEKADLSWSMAAIGVRSDQIIPTEAGGLGVAVVADMYWTSTKSSGTENLSAVSGEVTRVRVGVESNWQMVMNDDSYLTPRVNISVRRDSGDAETGWGIEAGAGVNWSDLESGLEIDIYGWKLITHSSDHFEDQGYTFTITYDSNPASNRGWSASYSQASVGSANDVFEALPETDLLGEEGSGDISKTAEIAYGMPAFDGQYTQTPYASVSESGSTRDLSIGGRLTPESGSPDFNFDVKGSRRESIASAPVYVFGMEMSVNW